MAAVKATFPMSHSQVMSCSAVTLRFGSKNYRGEPIDISANGVLLRTQCPVQITTPPCTTRLSCRGDATGSNRYWRNAAKLKRDGGSFALSFRAPRSAGGQIESPYSYYRAHSAQ